jgi:hypothetical protein
MLIGEVRNTMGGGVQIPPPVSSPRGSQHMGRGVRTCEHLQYSVLCGAAPLNRKSHHVTVRSMVGSFGVGPLDCQDTQAVSAALEHLKVLV